jgi:hypothetical protein
MTPKTLALGAIAALALAGGIAWYATRPATTTSSGQRPEAGRAERASGPAAPADLAAPAADPGRGARSEPAGRAPDAKPKPPAGAAQAAQPGVVLDAGMASSVDGAGTAEKGGFEEKYKDVPMEERRNTLAVLDSMIQELVATGAAGDAKQTPSIADLKAEAEWLRMHSEE